MDAITDFLSAVRVQGVCYGRIQITAPWAPRAEEGLHSGFGLISYGQAWIELPRCGRTHPSLARRFFSSRSRPRICAVIRAGGAPTAIIAGRFSFDEAHSRPLTDFLPPMILIRGGQPHILPLQRTLELLASEVDASKSTSEPGSELAVRRLADLLLIQALRAHIADSRE